MSNRNVNRVNNLVPNHYSDADHNNMDTMIECVRASESIVNEMHNKQVLERATARHDEN
jgi:hypothetical protein